MRTLRAALAVSLVLMAAVQTATAQRLVLTFDDGPSLQSTPLLTPPARQRALLDALARHRAQAVLFVTVGFGADRPEGLAMARAWGEAGHRIGNHTVTHPDLHDPRVSVERYAAEVEACDAVIRPLPGYRPWLRYTFLNEGNSAEKRDGMRALLQRIGVRRAPVDIDSGDWQLAPALVAALQGRADAAAGDRPAPSAELAALLDTHRRGYLAQITQRTAARLAGAAAGDAPAQVLLLHDNLATALWLDALLSQLTTQGWRFVEPEAAIDRPGSRLE